GAELVAREAVQLPPGVAVRDADGLDVAQLPGREVDEEVDGVDEVGGLDAEGAAEGRDLGVQLDLSESGDGEQERRGAQRDASLHGFRGASEGQYLSPTHTR